MIVADANLFVWLVTGSQPDTDPTLLRYATTLFRAAERGALMYTTSEAIIAEAVWVSSGRYGLDRAAVAIRLISLLELEGCAMPTRGLCIEALKVWATHRRVSFVDALAAAIAEQPGNQLATLDQDLARHTTADVWQPDPSDTD